MSATLRFRDLVTGAVYQTEAGGPNRRYVKLGKRRFRIVGEDHAPMDISSVMAVVQQPRAQPGEYAPLDGLAVWADEYDRLAGELYIYRTVAPVAEVNANYVARLTRERDCAAARVVGYARQVLALPARTFATVTP